MYRCDLERTLSTKVIAREIITGMDAEPIISSDVGSTHNEISSNPPTLQPFGTFITFIRVDETGAYVFAGCRTGFVNIVDQIDANIAFAAVAGIVAPVVDDVVSQIDKLDKWLTTCDTRIAAGVVCQEVVMVAGALATPDTTEAVGTFYVRRFSEAF